MKAMDLVKGMLGFYFLVIITLVLFMPLGVWLYRFYTDGPIFWWSLAIFFSVAFAFTILDGVVVDDVMNHIGKKKKHHWMTIDTAPKDGTFFLAHHEDEGQDGIRIVTWHGEKEHWAQFVDSIEDGSYFYESVVQPTHWMPLPTTTSEE